MRFTMSELLSMGGSNGLPAGTVVRIPENTRVPKGLIAVTRRVVHQIKR